MALVFDDVYRAELPYAVRTLRRLGVPEMDLPDAAHEVFVDVYEKLDTYDTGRPLRPWLFGFIYRVARDCRRRFARRRTEHLDDQTELVDLGDLPDEVAERRQKQGLAIRCLAQLAEEQAAVLVLHELDGVAVPEIARALSIPLNTAYSRLRLARQAFDAVACQIAKETKR